MDKLRCSILHNITYKTYGDKHSQEMSAFHQALTLAEASEELITGSSNFP